VQGVDQEQVCFNTIYAS